MSLTRRERGSGLGARGSEEEERGGARNDEQDEDLFSEDDSEDTEPVVCPGCYAVGAEECSPDCIDREIEQLNRDREDYASEIQDSWDDLPAWEQNELAADVERELSGVSLGASDDEDDIELVAESERVAPLQEAAAELALSCKRLDETVERLERSLLPSERAFLQKRFRPRGASCDGNGVRPRVTAPPPKPETVPASWSDRVQCPTCDRWHPVYLEAPPRAAERNVPSALTVSCPCGMRLSLAYSWRRACVVGLRFHRPARSGQAN